MILQPEKSRVAKPEHIPLEYFLADPALWKSYADEYYLQESVRGGDIPSLLEMLLRHLHDPEQVPNFAIRTARALVLELLRDSGGRRGRTANLRAALRQRLIHIRRADEIEDIRSRQPEMQEALADVQSLKKPPRRLLAERKFVAEACGTSWNDAFSAASRRLARSKAFGSPEALRKSWSIVQREGRGHICRNGNVYWLLGLHGILQDPRGVGSFGLMLEGSFPVTPKPRHYADRIVMENRRRQYPNRPAKPGTPAINGEELVSRLIGEESADESFRVGGMADNILMLLDGLLFYSEWGRRTPRYLLLKAVATIGRLWRSGGRRKKGRHADPVREALDRWIHVERWAWVESFREEQVKFARIVDGTKMCRHRDDQHSRRQYILEHKRLGKSFDQAIRLAVEELDGSLFAAQFDTLKKSHALVARNPAWTGIYRQFSIATARDLGIAHYFDKPIFGKKVA